MKGNLIAFAIGTLIGFGTLSPSTGAVLPPAGTSSNTEDSTQYRQLLVNGQVLESVSTKYKKLQKLVERRTNRMLVSMEKRDSSLGNTVAARDSVKAAQLFAGMSQKYAALRSSIGTPINNNIANPLKEYIPGVDSLQSALRFLTTQGSTLGLTATKLQQLQALSQQIQQFQGTLQQAEDAQQFVKTREQQLQSQLGQYGVGAQLSGINQEAYYAQQQIAEYKEMLHDRQKAEQKVITVAEQSPAFQNFMKKHSYLAQLFGLPDDYGTPQALVGLQTKAQVQQMINQATGSGLQGDNGSNPAQFIQQRVQQAGQQIDQLKNNLAVLGLSGGSGDMTMPEFKPNNQRTKTFLKRIVLGYSMQAQGATNITPGTENLALTATYKIRDNITAGIGGSYLLGVGNGIDHIAFSSQGVGLRSSFDIKAKGSFWITGGFEYNYLQAFRKWADLYQVNVWQKSALIGLSKKYKIKGGREGTLQLLYDALYNQHTPVSQPVVFRTGFTF